jgi:hypothetical protein
MAWRGLSWLITMLAVLVAWVLFRATSFDGAVALLRGMAGLNPALQLPPTATPMLWNAGLSPVVGGGWCLVLGAMAALAPNSNRIGEWLLTWCRDRASGRQILAGAALALALLLVVVNATRSSVSAFIYFNF